MTSIAAIIDAVPNVPVPGRGELRMKKESGTAGATSSRTASTDSDPASEPSNATNSGKPSARRLRIRRYLKAGFLLVLLFALGAIAFGIWSYYQPKELGAGFVSGNGRIEAVELSIAAKAAGRISEVYVDEGDLVNAGQLVVQMDTAALQTQLRQAQADEAQARNAASSAIAMVALQSSQKSADGALLAQREAELDVESRTTARARTLSLQHAVSMQELDEDLARQRVGTAAVVAARAQIAAAQSRVDAAEYQVLGAKAKIAAVQASNALIQTQIDDAALKTARSGRIQYRIAQPGEVIAAGGKVLGMVDLRDMSITFFLPEAAAGRVAIGSEVHIVLDADPDNVVPAVVSFVAIVAQFTPKSVETKSEREKLVFRVKARIDPKTLQQGNSHIKSGMPAMAYVRLDPSIPWPAKLSLRPVH